MAKSGGPALLFTDVAGQRPAGADQPVRDRAADVRGARHRLARRPRRADRVADGPPAAPGDGGEGARARAPARAGLLLVQAGARGPLPGGLAGRARPRPPADPHLLARGRRAVHHAAAGLQPRPAHRGAQLRHVPHPEARPAHGDDALADPQGRRRPPARLAGARAGGRGDRHPPGDDLLGHGAAAAGHRRDDLRRLPARAQRGDGALPDGRPRGAGRVRGRARGLRRRHRPAARGALRRPHRLLHAGRRLPDLPHHRHVDAPRTRSTRPRSSGRRRWRTSTWARRPSASSCRSSA